MRINVIFGPNLNVLQYRPTSIYGGYSMDTIINEIENTFPNIHFSYYQSNCEGLLIDAIQNSIDYDAIIVNLGGYTHTSISLRDALEYINIIKVEVHLSDIQHREEFRKVNYIKDVVDLSIIGKGKQGYIEAVNFILEKLYKYFRILEVISIIGKFKRILCFD
jgi:3-dehydroquinate dehydratase-2